MTLEERLKIINEEWYSHYAVGVLIQALRKAIEQRDGFIGLLVKHEPLIKVASENVIKAGNEQLLEILECK